MFRKLNRFNFKGSSLKVELSQKVRVQKFFIGNLAPEANPEEIADFFESYGVKVIAREGDPQINRKIVSRSLMLKIATIKSSDL